MEVERYKNLIKRLNEKRMKRSILTEKDIHEIESVFNGMALNFLKIVERFSPVEKVKSDNSARADICPTCKGSGNDPNWRHGSVDDCKDCKGTGKRSPIAQHVVRNFKPQNKKCG